MTISSWAAVEIGSAHMTLKASQMITPSDFSSPQSFLLTKRDLRDVFLLPPRNLPPAPERSLLARGLEDEMAAKASPRSAVVSPASYDVLTDLLNTHSVWMCSCCTHKSWERLRREKERGFFLLMRVNSSFCFFLQKTINSARTFAAVYVSSSPFLLLPL